MFRTSFIVFEVAFRTCDCRRVCLILSASCSSSTVAEAVKLLEDRGQVFKDLGEELEHLEGQKTLLKLQLVYWKERFGDTQTGHSSSKLQKRDLGGIVSHS